MTNAAVLAIEKLERELSEAKAQLAAVTAERDEAQSRARIEREKYDLVLAEERILREENERLKRSEHLKANYDKIVGWELQASDALSKCVEALEQQQRILSNRGLVCRNIDQALSAAKAALKGEAK